MQFDETGIADLKAGKIDPRVVAALTKLSEEHEITVTCMCSDHARATASGNVSNHSLGRGVDIGTIDGEIVRPNSPAARELATELSELDPDYRPNEIGSPFAIGQPGYFTDAAHQDHIHFGFKEEIARDWAPPADVAAGGGGAAPVAVASTAPPVAGATAPAPPAAGATAPAAPTEASEDSFMSAKAGASADGAAEGTETVDGDPVAAEDSFLTNKPVGPPSALAPDPSAVPAPVANAAAAGSSALGGSALETARTQLGVKEEGTNTGAKVDEYLAAAKVAPGNPWCASFVTWSLEQNGKKMEGGGWAAVQTWVRAAEAGTNDLQIVSAEDARPGDIVAYDWGGQDDFGSDGHIGFLDSEVKGGQFTALEGNNQDRVMNVPRHLDGANVKFIRVGGDAPPAPAPGAPPEAVGAGQVADAAPRRPAPPARTPTPATTRRRSRSRCGCRAAPRRRACRPSCR